MICKIESPIYNIYIYVPYRNPHSYRPLKHGAVFYWIIEASIKIKTEFHAEYVTLRQRLHENRSEIGV